MGTKGFEEPGDVQDIRLVVDTIPTLAWSARPDGSAEFFNQRWLDYTGLSAKQALGSGWEVAIHPDDLVLRQNSVRRQVLDLSALIRRRSRLNGHSPAPPASTPPDALRRPPSGRPGEPCSTPPI